MAVKEFSEVLADLLREEFDMDKTIYKEKAKMLEQKRKSVIKAEKMIDDSMNKADKEIKEKLNKVTQETQKIINALEKNSQKRIKLLKKVLDVKESRMIKSMLKEVIKGVENV